MSEITLGNHITTLKGFAFKSGWYSESGTPIVKVSNFTGDSVDTSNSTYLPKNIASEYTKYGIYSGDIVIQTVGSWPNNPQSVVGKVIKVPENAAGALLNQNAVKIEPDESLDKAYIYYVLKSDSFKKYIIGTAQGAANQASITLDAIRGYSFKRIPLSAQHKIASILSAYDDLIENNTRRIKILEEMARMIYRNIVETHCNASLPSNASLQSAALPDGWEIRKIRDVAKVNADSIKKKSEPEYINYIDIASVTTGQIDKVDRLTFNDAPGRARRIVKHGDVIWSMVRPNRKSYAMIIHPVDDMIVSTGFAVLTAVSIPYTYLFHAITTDDFVGYLINHATGSAYPAVNASDFENAEILVPPKNILDDFHKTTESIFLQCHKLQRKNQNLRQTRDLLLPKLISGEVAV